MRVNANLSNLEHRQMIGFDMNTQRTKCAIKYLAKMLRWWYCWWHCRLWVWLWSSWCRCTLIEDPSQHHGQLRTPCACGDLQVIQSSFRQGSDCLLHQQLTVQQKPQGIWPINLVAHGHEAACKILPWFGAGSSSLQFWIIGRAGRNCGAFELDRSYHANAGRDVTNWGRATVSMPRWDHNKG